MSLTRDRVKTMLQTQSQPVLKLDLRHIWPDLSWQDADASGR